MSSSQLGLIDAAVVPLPTAEQVGAEVQRMVDFGARLTGYPGHDQFCTWVEEEMRAAGLKIASYDVYEYDCYRTNGGAEEDREYQDPSATVAGRRHSDDPM